MRALQVVWQTELRPNDESCCEKDKSSASCQQQRRCQYRHAVRSGFLTAAAAAFGHGQATLDPRDPQASGENCHQRAKTQDILSGNSDSAENPSGPASSGPSMPCCPAAAVAACLRAAGRGRHSWRLFPIELEALTRFMPKNSRSTGRRQW